MSPRRFLIAMLVVLASIVAAPAVARADATQLYVPADGIDWAAGTVAVAADYPAGTRSIVFWADGQWLSTVAVGVTTLPGTVSSGVPLYLATKTTFRAEFHGDQDGLIGTATLELAPETYRPSAPRLSLATGAIANSSFTFRAISSPTVTGVTVETGPEPLKHPVTSVTGADGQITVSGVYVPYGVEWIKLTADNGFGSSRPSAARSVYNLGPKRKLPRRSRYVLVDKRSMTLYDVSRNRVLRHYDIAIGTPSTPTPNGYFKLGSARPASGAWGVLRRPLYRFFDSRLWPSGFYIHGTDAPWDIGTWASHGCVRLYDWAIRRFTKTVPNGTLVLIRH
jgi:L,D-transpeptidase catalytic domain